MSAEYVNEWEWDPDSEEYYYLFEDAGRPAMAYQSGRTCWVEDSARITGAEASYPTYEDCYMARQPYEYDTNATDFARLSLSGNRTRSLTAYGQPYEYVPTALSHPSISRSVDQRTRNAWRDMLHTSVRTDNPESFTDPELLYRGVLSHKLIMKTEGEAERLDPNYRRQRRRFFEVGKVFKILWAEEEVGTSDSRSIISEGMFGEPVTAKIRYFVVVKVEHDRCTCLPIRTYNYHGATSPDLYKHRHAVVYTGDGPPEPLPDELSKSRHGDGIHLIPIKVDPATPADKLDKLARIDYGKLYTIEFGVKACLFGKVSADWIPWLEYSFQLTLEEMTGATA